MSPLWFAWAIIAAIALAVTLAVCKMGWPRSAGDCFEMFLLAICAAFWPIWLVGAITALVLRLIRFLIAVARKPH